MLCLCLIFFKRILFPYFYQIIFLIGQTGRIEVFLRQQIRVKSRITRHRAVTVPRFRFLHKRMKIPCHIEIAVIDDTAVLFMKVSRWPIFHNPHTLETSLRFPATLRRAQSPVCPQHVMHRPFFHPVLYAYDNRSRRKGKQSLSHGRVFLQMLPTAHENKMRIIRVHALYNPLDYRLSHHRNKGFQLSVTRRHETGTIARHGYDNIHVLHPPATESAPMRRHTFSLVPTARITTSCDTFPHPSSKARPAAHRSKTASHVRDSPPAPVPQNSSHFQSPALSSRSPPECKNVP